MIKKTLYFGNPAYLNVQDKQLKVTYPKEEKPKSSVPIEDIGVLILDHPRITMTSTVLKLLLANNAAVISCNDQHLPDGLFLPLDKHHTQTENFRIQLSASLPLKKQLWAQTIKAKIYNQMKVLEWYGYPFVRLKNLVHKVKSGDPDNIEGQASAYYWSNILDGTRRHRYGEPPNHLLNYGYAILRAIVARGLVSSGMLPTIGIHHRNKYNAYCLADDIMEPYRPFVDDLVLRMEWPESSFINEITKQQKKQLLNIPIIDVSIDKNLMPLMIGVSRTTASLFACFDSQRKKILYPVIYE